MSKSVTLTQMIAQAREAADMVGSTFVSDTEITSLLNTYIAEVYDLLVSAYGPAFYASSYTFSTVAGQREYTLPVSPDTGADFLYLLGIDVDLGGGDIISCQPFSFYDRNRYEGMATYAPGEPIYYRLHGSKIWLIPTPATAMSVTVHYVPAAPTLSSGGTTSWDGINGWERLPVVNTAIAMLQKEESDPSILLAERQSLLSRIQSMSKHRDAGMPERIVDVRGRLRGGRRGGWE